MRAPPTPSIAVGPEVGGDRGDGGGPADVDLQDDDEHRRDRHRAGDRHDAVEDRGPQAPLVHAADEQQEHDQRREEQQRPALAERAPARAASAAPGRARRRGRAASMSGRRKRHWTIRRSPERLVARDQDRDVGSARGQPGDRRVQGHGLGGLAAELDAIHVWYRLSQDVGVTMTTLEGADGASSDPTDRRRRPRAARTKSGEADHEREDAAGRDRQPADLTRAGRVGDGLRRPGGGRRGGGLVVVRSRWASSSG